MKNRKIILSYLLVFLLGFLAEGCQKEPINGALDGQWEVIEVMPQPETIVIEKRLFYNFSLHVCALTYYEALFMNGNMDYDQSKQTLWLEFPYADSESDILALRQYGILSNPVTFHVDFKDKHHLTLTNQDATVVLVKH